MMRTEIAVDVESYEDEAFNVRIEWDNEDSTDSRVIVNGTSMLYDDALRLADLLILTLRGDDES